jgi:hypothetical protein
MPLKVLNKFDRANWLKPVILVTREVNVWRIIVQGQPRQKAWETSSQPVKAGHDFPACHPSYMVQSGPGVNARPYPNNN